MALPEKQAAKLWVWRAYDVDQRRTVAWMPGGREDATCRRLIGKVGLIGKTFVTDNWEGCHRVIPQEQSFTGKDLTFPIEQDDSNVRHCLARFRRRTKVVSNCRTMVDLSLRLLPPCNALPTAPHTPKHSQLSSATTLDSRSGLP